MSNDEVALSMKELKDKIKLLRSEYAQVKQWLSDYPDIFEEHVGPMLAAKGHYYKGEIARLKKNAADYMLGLDVNKRSYDPPVLQYADEAMIQLDDALKTNQEMHEQYSEAFDAGKDLSAYKEGIEASDMLLTTATDNIRTITADIEEATYGQ